MTNKNESEAIKAIHPLFRSQSCQFLLKEPVSIIHDDNRIEERLLIVASPGIFLIKKHYWRLQLETSISFNSIIKIDVQPEFVTIYKDQKTFIRFTHLKRLEIASKIHGIRSSLFGHYFSSQYELIVNNLIRDNFSCYQFNYQPTSIIVDIFLTNILKYAFQSINSNQISNLTLLLNKIQETGVLKIDQDFLSLPYLPAIIDTVAISEHIHELWFVNINIGLQSIENLLISILTQSTTIQRLIFNGSIFDDSDFGKFSSFMGSNPTFCVDEWIFNNCDFRSNSRFVSFFHAFYCLAKPIHVLAFNKCQFSSQCILDITRDFLFSVCFHSLEVLWLSDIQFPEEILNFLMQLISSDWFVKSQSLNTLVLNNCGLQLSELFEKLATLLSNKTDINHDKSVFGLMINNNILTNKINLHFPTIDLSGNFVLKNLTEDFRFMLSNKMNLILRNCSFSDESLSSLFKALSLHTGESLSLDLSHILISNNGWSVFSKEIFTTPLKLNSLTELIWDHNEITIKNVESFVCFLKEQPNLQKLSINDSIVVISSESEDTNSDQKHKGIEKVPVHLARSERDIQTIIDCFMDFVNHSKLTSISIKSTSENTCIGPQLYPLLDYLLKNNQMKTIDITGQMIGHYNLWNLVNSLSPSLTDFMFDGNSNSIEIDLAILDFLFRIKKSKKTNFSEISFLNNEICKFENIQFVHSQTNYNQLIYDKNLPKIECCLENISFPSNDISRNLKKLSNSKIQVFRTKVEMLKKMYHQIFPNGKNYRLDSSNILHDVETLIHTIHRYQNFSRDLLKHNECMKSGSSTNLFNSPLSQLPNSDQNEKRNKIPSLGQKLHCNDNSQSVRFCIIDDQVRGLLNECGYNNNKNDPMTAILSTFSNKFSLDSLKAMITTNQQESNL